MWDADPNDDPADVLACHVCGARIQHARLWVRGPGGDPRPACSHACACAAREYNRHAERPVTLSGYPR